MHHIGGGNGSRLIREIIIMARYTKTVDIWDNNTNVKALQPGQWVEAGKGGDRGIFCGVKASGSVVVAWYGNAKAPRPGGYRGYIADHFRYARNYK